MVFQEMVGGRVASLRSAEEDDAIARETLPRHIRSPDSPSGLMTDPATHSGPHDELPGHLVVSWPAADDGMAKCIASSTRGVHIYKGKNWPAATMSSTFSKTAAHVKDCLQGSVDDLVFGRPKLWFFVPGASPSLHWP